MELYADNDSAMDLDENDENDKDEHSRHYLRHFDILNGSLDFDQVMEEGFMGVQLTEEEKAEAARISAGEGGGDPGQSGSNVNK